MLFNFLAGQISLALKFRAVARALIGGRGVHSYIRVMPDQFLLKSDITIIQLIAFSTGFELCRFEFKILKKCMLTFKVERILWALLDLEI